MLKASISYKEKIYNYNPQKPIDISIPIREGEENVNCYYAETVKSEIIRMGNFVGSVAEGGTVNYRKVTITPHGNGTHTECYAHISTDKITVNEALEQFLFFTQLISITPKELGNGDFVVCFEDFENQIDKDNLPQAIIIRTLPNLAEKINSQYSGSNPPYLDSKIGVFLQENNIEHLLVDLPSVDKEVDGGKLLTHKSFWNYPKSPRAKATITELIYVPSETLDGFYLLNLQIISLQLDASPSKPILYTLLETAKKD